MLRWQPYKVFDWVWLRHDFTKLKATRQPQHLNSVTRSVSPCLDLFICRLWASHPPAGLDQQHCTWRPHGCVLAGLSPTALKTATHTHLPIETTRSWECVCVCTTLPVTPERSVSGTGCERAERLRMTALQEWNTLFANAVYEHSMHTFWNIGVLKSRCNHGFTILRVGKHLAFISWLLKQDTRNIIKHLSNNEMLQKVSQTKILSGTTVFNIDYNKKYFLRTKSAY